jgi:asparagine N-glycosylation enzyme membrane subunit Stt3
MPLGDYLPIVIGTVLFYATLSFFINIFLGHYGIVQQALLAVLLICTLFLPKNWGIIVLVQLEWMLVQLEWMVREAIRILESDYPA